ncbi:hypothetical protein [Pseudomonas alloputida]|uniref:hypothetical protein n=1 Tax=Pseudomonas alloputida TaxID=1940621 RepID=UPI003866577D
MEEKVLKSKSWVANYFYSKVCEYQHYLEQVVGHCDGSMARFSQKLPPGDNEGRLLTYAYGSLNNMVQTLKDGGSVFLPTSIGWGDIKKLRHGEFFYLSRNASTHDGNPIINGWADGKYYVAHDIERFDGYGKFIKIPRPVEDVRTFTLEFSIDLYDLLAARLTLLGDDHQLIQPLIGPSEIELIMGSQMIPEDVRNLFSGQMDEIKEKAGQIKVDPISKALEQIRTGVDYIRRVS